MQEVKGDLRELEISDWRRAVTVINRSGEEFAVLHLYVQIFVFSFSHFLSLLFSFMGSIEKYMSIFFLFLILLPFLEICLFFTYNICKQFFHSSIFLPSFSLFSQVIIAFSFFQNSHIFILGKCRLFSVFLRTFNFFSRFFFFHFSAWERYFDYSQHI